MQKRKICPFICKEIKWNIGAGRRSEVAEGVFFPILAAGTNEGGESVYNVSYTLDRVVVPHRIYSVVAGDALEIDMTLDSGGSASATIMGVVTMGGVDITATALTVNARTARVYIAQVTGDVVIQASYNVPSAMTVRCTLENVTSNAPASVNSGSPLSVVLTGVNGNKVQENSVIVTMGGNDITTTAYNHATKTISIARVTGNVSIKAVGRPYDAEVEWLQSDGSAYIDTLIAFTDNFAWEIKFEGFPDGTSILGARTSTVRTCCLYHYNSVYHYSIPIANKNGLQTPFTLGDLSGGVHIVKAHIASNKGDVWVDGAQTYTNQSFTGTYISDVSCALFASKFGDNDFRENTIANIYYFKMWQNDNLVAHFIPVRDNGVGYLYDKVSGQLFGNDAGSGAFTYGNDV